MYVVLTRNLLSSYSNGKVFVQNFRAIDQPQAELLKYILFKVEKVDVCVRPLFILY